MESSFKDARNSFIPHGKPLRILFRYLKIDSTGDTRIGLHVHAFIVACALTIHTSARTCMYVCMYVCIVIHACILLSPDTVMYDNRKCRIAGTWDLR
jgi:hypothetical protein